jgi:hypothetical protein
VRRLGSLRPELQILEDRLPPGQVWLGSMVGASLLGPSFTALQLDAAADEASVAAAPNNLSSTSSGSSALLLTDAGAVPVQGTVSLVAQTPVQTGSATPATRTDGGNSLVSGNDGLNQEAYLAGLAASARHHLPRVSSAGAAANQPAGDAGGTAVFSAGSGSVIGYNGSMPPLDNSDAVTAPYPTGGGGKQQVGTPTNNGNPPPGGSLVGPNTLTNNPAPCSSNTGVIKSETAITTSGNTVVVGYNDFRGFYCPQNGFQVNGWAYSTDRGHTWTDGGPLPGSTQWRGDPWLATGPDGTIYMAGLYGNPNLTSIGVLRGTVDPNTGLVSWSSPTIVNLGAPDKEAMTVDPNSGTIYISYTSFSGNQSINLIQSNDGGLTFSAPVVVTTGSVQGSQVAVGPDGEVYVCWDIGYPSDSGIGFAYSFDGGHTFTVKPKIENTVNTPFPIPGTDRTPAFPHMAVDLSGGPYTGTIYITWQSAHLSGHLDALLTWSNDAGQDWTAPITVNDDGTNALHWYPTVSVDNNGYVHVFFYDRRDHPGTTLTNLYYARSIDGGQSFQPNLRVTDTDSNFHTSTDGAPAWGDYINSYADGTSVVVAWADGRLGQPNTDFARVGSR